MASERAAGRPRTRRRYTDEQKAEIVAECEAAGASVAQVAMSHGINANIVHRWRQWAREGKPKSAVATRSEFVPVALAPTAVSVGGNEICIEIRRGATAIKVNWPASAAGDCAAWLRDWLK